jgi:hypothetical protein
MAIFASTTTSGYSDPLKAYSIKALEQRQRDMLQQQTQQPQAFTPENTQTPLQGLAQVANVGVDAFRQRRTDDAVAAQKDELSKLIAGTPAGQDLSPQAQARMAVIAPDMYKEVVSTIAARRAQQELFAQQEKTQQAGFKHADQAQIDAENRLQARPTDEPLVTLRRAFDRKEINQEEYDARKKNLLAPKVNEQKFVKDLQEQSVAGQSLLASLDEAKALTEHPKGIHSGGGAGFIQGVGEMVPKSLQGVASAAGLDPETVSNTQRYNQIMGEQALELLNKMKGASSDRDVQVNFKIVNDPAATLENKRKALGRMRDRIATLLELHNNTIKEAGGTVPTLSTAGSGGAATPAATGGGGDANAEAKAWLAANPNDPRAEAVRKKLGGG